MFFTTDDANDVLQYRLESEEKESPVVPLVLVSTALAVGVVVLAWMFRTSNRDSS